MQGGGLKDIKIFSCSYENKLASSIADAYGKSLGRVDLEKYQDGEFRPIFKDTVRGSHVFIIGSTYQPAENMIEVLLMIDAAKRSSANHITAVMPYFGWARQDRKDKPRVPIASKMFAQMLQTAGANRIITMDLHVDQIQGFFEIPVDHIYASPIFIPYIKGLELDELVIASPDMGGSKRAYAYSKYLNSEVAICYKQREVANKVSSMQIIGDVSGKNVIIVDDIIDTGGTLIKSAEMMIQSGAKSVRGLCSHALLSGHALENLEKSCLEELITTDSIPLKNKSSDKVKVLNCGGLIARIMRKVYECSSINEEFLI